jgi:hypothetical protein
VGYFSSLHHADRLRDLFSYLSTLLDAGVAMTGHLFVCFAKVMCSYEGVGNGCGKLFTGLGLLSSMVGGTLLVTV